MVVLLVLAALWARTVWEPESWSLRRGSTVLDAGTGRYRVALQEYRLASGAGVVALWWRGRIEEDVEPDDVVRRWAVLKGTSLSGTVREGFFRERLGDTSILSGDGRPAGPQRTLRWAWCPAQPDPLTPRRPSSGHVAMPYWLLMLPWAVPPVWWLWCPVGRAWPRMTTRRALLAIAALAIVLANLVQLWRASAVPRARELIVSLGGSIEPQHRTFGPEGRAGLWIRLDNESLTDSDMARARSAIAALTEARALSLGTKITDAGLARVDALIRLESLDLRGPGITDAGLTRLQGLHGLRSLSLSRTGVSDAGLVQLRGLTRLEQLNLSETRITDSGLSKLASLTGLRDLDLTGTHVSDAGLVHLKALTHLRLLHTGHTGVTDPGMAAFEKSLPILALQALERSVRRGDERTFGELTRTRAPDQRAALWARLEDVIRRHPFSQPDYSSRAVRNQEEGARPSRWINPSVAEVEIDGTRAVVTDGRCRQVMVFEDGHWKADLDDGGNIVEQ